MNRQPNIFEFTDSKISAAEIKKQKNDQNYVNLLDLSSHYNDNADQMISFQQFKQCLNAYDFEKNQQFIQKTTKIQSTMLIPRFPRGQSLSERNKTNNYQFRKSGSLQYQIPDKSQNSNQHLNTNMNFLNQIREQLQSKASTQKNMVSQQQNLNLALHLTTHINISRKNSNRQSGQSSSIHHSSAHSTRSFNGLQQINDYQIQKKIGQGAFATVMLCINVKTQQKYAMKIVSNKELRRKLFTRNSQMLAHYYINNQIALLKKMEHQHIVRLYEVIQDQSKNKIYLILQYCSGGYINQMKVGMSDSRKIQNQYRKLLQSQCKRYYRQLCLAVDYIHNVANISHRDIKPQNILLSDKDQVKLSDFGLGTEDIQVTSKSGTKAYLPPQSRNQNAISMSLTVNTVSAATQSIKSNLPKVTTQMGDIWAIGITLMVMLYGKYQQIDDNKIQAHINSMKDISIDCKDFLLKCLKINPFQRITASEMLDHPWIKAKKNTYHQIHITKQQQQAAIVARNKKN